MPSAERIEVRLEDGGGQLVLSVADDGRGFDTAAPALRGRQLGPDVDGGARAPSWAAGSRSVGAGRGHDGAAGGAGVIRVLIADDHAVVRQGLRTYLELQEDVEVVAEAADGEAAVRAAERLAPDVVLLDLAMPRLDGVAALRELREQAPDARVLVLTSFGEDDRLFAALRAGAAGFLLKDTEPAELVRAIRTAHAGQSPLSPAIADARGRGARPRRPPARRRRCSRRASSRCCALIARGRSNKRIALELGVAEKTVKTHVGHVLGQARPQRSHAGGAVRRARGARET